MALVRPSSAISRSTSFPERSQKERRGKSLAPEQEELRPVHGKARIGIQYTAGHAADDARSYYTLFDYLETLVDDSLQNALHEQAMGRFARDPLKVEEIERRWKSIMKRRDEMSVNLRGALEAYA